MTDRLSVALTRPDPAPDRGPLDDRLYDLVEERFRALLVEQPALATWVGIHDYDDRLGDGSREVVLGRLDADRRHLSAVEALDPAALSEAARLEREIELHNVRRSIFDLDVVRTWERRSTAIQEAGDALFLTFARDFAPLPDRLRSLSGRIGEIPTHLAQHRTRAVVPQVRLWQQLEIEAARELPSFLDVIVATGRTALPEADAGRLARAADAARAAIAEHDEWLRATLAGGTDEWALGRDRYAELVRLRAFDGLDADAILALGEEALAREEELRRAVAREIDPDASVAEVLDRVKSDHRATFAEALEGYRSAMLRARRHLIERGIVTVPEDERLEVLETPGYLRHVIPFAAYFPPPKFDASPSGLYVVTPSVDGDPRAMREHNWSSISNTSIHEAYPGHHLQLSIAARHPSLTRLLTDAPEFVEGWGMYSEQLMREHGFDDAPPFRLIMHTDAIWRACRIVLDVRMHRGEVDVAEATRFLVERTGFEEPNARAEVHRYTYTPTYQLSYLLGKMLILALRSDEQRRLGEAFDLRHFHDRLLANGSLPISFHRRILAAEAPAGVGSPAARPGERTDGEGRAEGGAVDRTRVGPGSG
ncbi:MAG TPA: DUF885 domain-containing protein [Candidatus Limnocylindrales bacterium]|nr:DUF885 domain-containing protein [Candidatus Limnocylindrales bacterium]